MPEEPHITYVNRPPHVSLIQEDELAKLVCPICGFDYVHMGAVTVAQGTKIAVMEADQVHVSELEPHGRRGSTVDLEFSCENGHEFIYQLEFRKGFVHVGMLTRDGDGGGHELWRD